MPEYEISGIPVNFPFEPYALQRAYMEKIITCLREGTNGILESPTGTGKTLSLLCSTLAWVHSRKQEQERLNRQNKAKQQKFAECDGETTAAAAAASNVKLQSVAVPKIIYASRTHSQLAQAMRELKRTAYSFMRSVVLGSREQFCINPDVMTEKDNAAKLQMCKTRVSFKQCSYQLSVEELKDHPDLRGPSIMDIEDLVSVGRRLRVCPYYAVKELVADADITFMPYNYLLDPRASAANKVELTNTIVILDEAHNIEKVCEDSASVQIRSADIETAIEEMTAAIKLHKDGKVSLSAGAANSTGEEAKDLKLEDLEWLKDNLGLLQLAINDIRIENPAEGLTLPAAYIFELLGKANFTRKTSKRLSNLLERLIQFMMAAVAQGQTVRRGGSFMLLQDIVQGIFDHKEGLLEKINRSFKVHIDVVELKEAYNAAPLNGWLTKPTKVAMKREKVVNFWCLNPGFGMYKLLSKRVRSLILTSGTLAPLKPLIAELDLPVAQHLENPHIIADSQVHVRVIGAGPDREPLVSNYKNRDNPKYISSLGQTILNVARIVPDGLLVFFPSYPMLNQSVSHWQASGLWTDISRHKPIFIEPRGKDAFTLTMEEFYQAIRDSKGACFLAVCRGKVSEGLDFADRNGRAVIISGLPFPPLKDPKVILKKQYLEETRTKENELLGGQAWYALEAIRAVNQAIGRVIRHRHDYGAILLCDARFQNVGQVNQLSKWVRKHISETTAANPNFGVVIRELRTFFKHAEANAVQPEQRIVEAIDQKRHVPAVEVSEKPTNQKHVVRSKYFAKRNRKQAAEQDCAGEELMCSNSKPTYVARKSLDEQTCKRANFTPPKLSAIKTVDLTQSQQDDGDKKKRRRLLESEDSTATSTSSLSQSSGGGGGGGGTLKWGSKQLEPLAQLKEAPNDRAEFLRELRTTLTAEEFNAFTKALFEYKAKSIFGDLTATLKIVLGAPGRLHMLRGMRRFTKTEHREEFDAWISDF